MKKKDLINKVSKQAKITQKQAEIALAIIWNEMMQAAKTKCKNLIVNIEKRNSLNLNIDTEKCFKLKSPDLEKLKLDIRHRMIDDDFEESIPNIIDDDDD